MDRENPNLKGSPKAAALALLTVLALLVAPICAPLCAARICSTNSDQQSCHNMTAMADDGGDRIVAPSKACGFIESSAVLVRPDEQLLNSHSVGNNSAHILRAGSCEPALPILKIDTVGAQSVPLETSNPLPQTAILRI